MSSDFDLGDVIRNAVRNAFRELSSVTVLIAGRTGVGKSTLINAVFSGRMADTGQGRPITTATREYTTDGVPVRIIDTQPEAGIAHLVSNTSLTGFRASLVSLPRGSVDCALTATQAAALKVNAGEDVRVVPLSPKDR